MNLAEALALLGIPEQCTVEEREEHLSEAVFVHRDKLLRDVGRLPWLQIQLRMLDRLAEAESLVTGRPRVNRRGATISIVQSEPADFLRTFETVNSALRLFVSKAKTFHDLHRCVSNWMDCLVDYRRLYPRVFARLLAPTEQMVRQQDALDTAEAIGLFLANDVEAARPMIVREWKRIEAWDSFYSWRSASMGSSRAAREAG